MPSRPRAAFRAFVQLLAVGVLLTVLFTRAGLLGALAQGDLTKRIDANYEGTFGRLKDDANGTAEKLTAIVSQIPGTDVTLVDERALASLSDSVSPAGVVNLAPFSFFNCLSADPALVALGVVDVIGCRRMGRDDTAAARWGLPAVKWLKALRSLRKVPAP